MIMQRTGGRGTRAYSVDRGVDSLCRNKSKYEYTLQGWKAFALSHSVRSGDRLQIELLPDGRRVRADIVKRASPKDRTSAEVGPASPAVMDVASVAKPSSGVASCGCALNPQVHDCHCWATAPTCNPFLQSCADSGFASVGAASRLGRNVKQASVQSCYKPKPTGCAAVQTWAGHTGKVPQRYHVNVMP